MSPGSIAVASAAPSASVARSFRHVVQPRRDDRNSARHQLRGTGAASAMARHIIHLAVPAAAEPLHQPPFILREIDSRDGDRIEAELAAPLANSLLDAVILDAVDRVLHEMKWYR